jgi:hypothetical protein
MKEKEMLAALDAEWKEISIVENMESVKIMVLVRRVIEPASLPTPEPVQSDPR